MSRIASLGFSCIAVSAVIAAGCFPEPNPTSSGTPAAPTMPSHWKVTSDVDFPADQIKPIAEKLGGNVTALRNTDYDVNGKRLRINTIVASDDANADSIMESLRKMKSDVALLRKGLIIYEFVGTNDVLPEIGEGKAHIEGAG